MKNAKENNDQSIGQPKTQAALISELAEQTSLPKTKTKEILEKLGAIAIIELRHTRQFSIPVIGKLLLTSKAARVGRNPKTGEEIEIPERNNVKLKPSKLFKDALQ